jgi:PAS domain S-box-containing protein
MSPTDDDLTAVGSDEESNLRGNKRFFDQSMDLCCIAGTDTYFRTVNPAFEKALGYSSKQLLQMSFLELIHPDDRQPTVQEINKLSQGQDCVQFENRYRCQDGSWKWLSWNCPAADPSTGLLYATARDVTLQKASEVALRIRDSAFSAMSHGLVITDAIDAENPIIYINPAFEALTGYSESEIVGRNCRFLQNDDTDQNSVKSLRDAISEGRPCRVLLRNYRKCGQLFWNELSISPVKDGDGVVTNFIGFQNDVTARIGHEKLAWDEFAERIESLTPRQRQILDGLVAGQGIKQVASNLSISHKTAEMHRTNLLDKMQVPDVASLVRLMLTNGPPSLESTEDF